MTAGYYLKTRNGEAGPFDAVKLQQLIEQKKIKPATKVRTEDGDIVTAEEVIAYEQAVAAAIELEASADPPTWSGLFFSKKGMIVWLPLALTIFSFCVSFSSEVEKGNARTSGRNAGLKMLVVMIASLPKPLILGGGLAATGLGAWIFRNRYYDLVEGEHEEISVSRQQVRQGG